MPMSRPPAPASLGHHLGKEPQRRMRGSRHSLLRGSATTSSSSSSSLTKPLSLLALSALISLCALPPSAVAAASCDRAAPYSTYSSEAAGKSSAEVRAWLHDIVIEFHSPKSYDAAYYLLAGPYITTLLPPFSAQLEHLRPEG